MDIHVKPNVSQAEKPCCDQEYKDLTDDNFSSEEAVINECNILERDTNAICSFATAAALQMIRRQSYVSKRNETSKRRFLKRCFCCISTEKELRPLDDECREKLRTSFSHGDNVRDNPLLIRSRSSTGRKMSVSEGCEIDRAIVYETLKSYTMKKVLEEMF